VGAIPAIIIAVILVAVAAGAAYALGSRIIAPILGALVAGPACYFLAGVFVPRFTGEGHFFSVPFGGLAVSDGALVSSLLAWILVCSLAFYFLTARRRKGSGSSPDRTG